MTFEEFVSRRLSRLLGAAWAMCGDHSLAEDLVQDVLIKAHLRWDRISVMENPDGYVRTMLVNEFLSWRRRWPRVVLVAEVPERGRFVDHAIAHAERSEMSATLAGLPRQQRVVLALRYYEGLSDTEIASVMRCSPGTVRGYASRGLATLRSRVADVRAGAGEVDG